MNRIVLTFHFLLFISIGISFAQCPMDNEEIILLSQEEVENFAIDYPNCEILQLGLRIKFCSNGNGTPITDLSPLSNLKEIKGQLSISGCKDIEVADQVFINLNGLHNLESAERLLVSTGNLKSLSELSQINELVSIILSQTQNLESLDMGEIKLTEYVSIFGNTHLNSIGSIQTNPHMKFVSVKNNPVLNIGESFKDLTSVETLQLNHHDISFVNDIEYIENLTVEGNEHLTDLKDFSSLKSLSTSLYLSDLDSLVNFEFLNNVDTDFTFSLRLFRLPLFTSITNLGNKPEYLFLILDSCPLLTDISIFESVSSIRYDLGIYNMDGLVELSAFKNVLHIGNEIDIRDNKNLTSIGGFQELKTVGDEFFIRRNPWLVNVDEFMNLETIGASSQEGYFSISENPSLSSIQGLKNVTGGFESLSIFNNPLLPSCEIESVCETLKNNLTANIKIENNLAGCNSQVEVENNCLTLSTSDNTHIQLTIYPNPASQSIQFSSDINDRNLAWEIYGASGKFIKKGINNTGDIIDISDLKPGLYFIQVKSTFKKIIIQ